MAEPGRQGSGVAQQQQQEGEEEEGLEMAGDWRQGMWGQATSSSDSDG